MIFDDNKGIKTILFGTGDILIGGIGFEPKDNSCTGICFIPTKEGKIGRTDNEHAGKKDYKAGVDTKILFTNSKSIDVLIKQLLIAKKKLQ